MENNKPDFKVKKKEQQTIGLHNTPEFYKEYTRKWADSIDKPLERAIMSDIATLVEVACQHLTPQQTDSANDKNQK